MWISFKYTYHTVVSGLRNREIACATKKFFCQIEACSFSRQTIAFKKFEVEVNGRRKLLNNEADKSQSLEIGSKTEC